MAEAVNCRSAANPLSAILHTCHVFAQSQQTRVLVGTGDVDETQAVAGLQGSQRRHWKLHQLVKLRPFSHSVDDEELGVQGGLRGDAFLSPHTTKIDQQTHLHILG